MPLHAWDSTTLAKIGGCFGKLVDISKETFEKRFLEFGRVRVQVERYRSIDEEMKIENFGRSFSVFVKEEKKTDLFHSQKEGFNGEDDSPAKLIGAGGDDGAGVNGAHIPRHAGVERRSPSGRGDVEGSCSSAPRSKLTPAFDAISERVLKRKHQVIPSPKLPKEAVVWKCKRFGKCYQRKRQGKRASRSDKEILFTEEVLNAWAEVLSNCFS